MATDKAKIAKKQYVTVKRYERRLLNRLADIEWEETELKPQVEELERQMTKGQIPKVRLEIEDKTHETSNS